MQLLALLVAALLSAQPTPTTSISPDDALMFLHANGSLIIAAPPAGAVLLNGRDLVAENAMLAAALGELRQVVAGLGIKQWTPQLGANETDIGVGVATDALGNIAIVGFTTGGLEGIAHAGRPGLNDAFVAKFDPAGNTLWVRQLGSDGGMTGRGVAFDSLGNVYISGSTYKKLGGDSDAFVAKLDGFGKELWTQDVASDVEDSGFAIATDAQDNVLVCGMTRGGLHGQHAIGADSDVFLVMYNSAGDRLWTRLLASPASEFGRAMVFDKAGDLIVVGDTTGSLNGSKTTGSGKDLFLAKYNSTGGLLWIRQLSSGTDDVGNNVAVDGAGNIFVVGSTRGALDGLEDPDGTQYQVVVIKFTSSGDRLWTRQFGTENEDVGIGAAVDAFGAVYVSGYTYGNLNGNTNVAAGATTPTRDIYLAKLDPTGGLQWTRQFGSVADERADNIAVDSKGNVFLVGSTFGDVDGHKNGGGGKADILLIKFGLPK